MALCLALLLPVSALAQSTQSEKPVRKVQNNQVKTALPDSSAVAAAKNKQRSAVLDEKGDTVKFTANDSIILAQAKFEPDTASVANLGKIRILDRDPLRAMWLSALCPGLGQIYNHRYWKLPIIVGAFVGLGYGTAWNNKMYGDYTKAYRDITDSDPNTKSYMDFFPSTVEESDLDKTWLTKTLKSKRTYYRRYREICIIGLAAIYLLNIVDAYVDASLTHFDISSDLSMDVAPASIDTQISRMPSLGLQCAINF